MLVCVLCLYPATPGWGVRFGCVRFGWGFGCAPPLLAGVLGCARLCACIPCTPPLLAGVCGVGVCVWALVSAAPRHPWLGCWCVRACVGAPLVACHSWLGCAVCGCVLGLGFWLRPASPGWGVGACVCWCGRSACTSPLLAGMCVGGVCVWAPVSAAPATPGSGFGVCVFVCLLPLYPANPGRDARRGCVCLGSGFGCAPPFLAGVLGCVCALVRAPLVPRHSWLGCAVWVCVFRLGFGCAPPLLAGALGCVCAGVGPPLVPRHSWLGFAVWACVLGLGFRLRPATPGWGVGLCVCSCARSACTLPLLPGVCGGDGCVWARVSAAPNHSWLGCWSVRFFFCLLPLYPATPGWGVPCGCVCLSSGFGCALPLLAGVLGCVCAGVGAPPVPCHSWLGCALWVCVFELGFPVRPATPGWGVGVCVCSCACPPCTQQLLAGLCRVGVGVWARILAAPRHSWLGCWGVCVLLCVALQYPATPGWGVRCGCVCLGSGFGCAPPLLAWVLGCVCAGVRAPPVSRHSGLGCAAWVCVLGLGFRLRPATPGWGVGLCVCSCARSACTLPLLAGVRGVGMCIWTRGSAAPRQCWLGCWAVCVLVCALRLHPAIPGWGARCGCVCSVLGFGCAPPLLAGVLGCVCAGVRAPPVRRHSSLGCTAGVCVLGLGFWLRPATPGWGVWCVRWLLPGTCSCAVIRWLCARSPGFWHPVAVAAWHLSVCLGCGRRRASLACLLAPRWCAAPLPVGSLPVLLSAFPTPWCLSPPRGLAPPALLGGCAGHAEAGREPGSLCLPLAPAEAGALGSLRVVPVRGPAMGLSLAGPSGVHSGLRALRWLACVDSVTDVSGFLYRPSLDGGLGRCTGAV